MDNSEKLKLIVENNQDGDECEDDMVGGAFIRQYSYRKRPLIGGRVRRRRRMRGGAIIGGRMRGRGMSPYNRFVKANYRKVFARLHNPQATMTALGEMWRGHGYSRRRTLRY